MQDSGLVYSFRGELQAGGAACLFVTLSLFFNCSSVTFNLFEGFLFFFSILPYFELLKKKEHFSCLSRLVKSTSNRQEICGGKQEAGV